MVARGRKQLGEFLLVALAQVAMMIGGFATIKILSNVLDLREFGIYSLLLSVATFAVAVLFVPIGQLNMRFITRESQTGPLKDFYAHQVALIYGGLALSFLAAAICLLLMPTKDINSWFAFASLFTLIVFMGLQSTQQFELMAFRKRREGSIAQLIGAVSRPLFAYLAMVALGFDAVAATAGIAIGFAILCLVQFCQLRPVRRQHLEKEQGKDGSRHRMADNRDYLNYCLFFSLQGAVSLVLLNADRWVLGGLDSIENVAIIAALMQLSLVAISFSYAVLSRYAAPIYFATEHNSDETQSGRHMRHMLVGWLVVCVAIIAISFQLHRPFVRLATNDTYANFSYLLPWMIIGLALDRTAQLLELEGGLKLRTNAYVAPRLIMIVFIPLAEIFFYWIYGVAGVVVGMIVGALASLGATIAVNKLLLQKKSS